MINLTTNFIKYVNYPTKNLFQIKKFKKELKKLIYPIISLEYILDLQIEL